MVILKAENISKQYRLGLVGAGTLSEDLNRLWYKIRGKEDPYLKIGAVNNRSDSANSDYVWALKDINFEVEKGEILGIIGKNGAGKSTLLKLLSRVTTPTTGKIKTRGNIASLLEVGTGFHPELTGRENIFLNGAILGMTKDEIDSKLEEIIQFSGCEMFIDTPVKRYSSGMKVRLGFAVAAHLEPDILVVDEVLAVGDAEFQKKAIGKMHDISKGGGRTVLFVSHNMASVKGLCTRSIVLESGSIVFNGDTDEAIDFYLSRGMEQQNIDLRERTDRRGNGDMKLIGVNLYNSTGMQTGQIVSGDPLKVELIFEKNSKHIDFSKLFIGVTFRDEHDQAVLGYLSDEMAADFRYLENTDRVILKIPRFNLRAGTYYIRVQVQEGKVQGPSTRFDFIERAASILVLPGKIWEGGKLNRSGKYAILPGQFEIYTTENKTRS